VVFTRLGSDNARTLDVAQEAGVNEALIYKHFSSKQELYEAAVLEPLREFIAHLGPYADRVLAAPDEAGRRAVIREVHREFALSMRQVAPLLGVAVFSNMAEGAAFYRDEIAPLLGTLAAATGTAAATWNHRDTDFKTLVVGAFGMHFALAMHAAMSGDPGEPEREAADIADLIFYGYALDEDGGQSGGPSVS
jgi:TetR/AcrR family transcriptional regulator